jgi:phosphatidylinositol alpha-mannosyltransferase
MLMQLGHEARILIGNDPPGRLTRTLHPREGRHGELPAHVIPVGRTVIIPANGSLSNICLTPAAMTRMKRAFARERFDVLHVHEPLAPILSQYALAAKPCPIVTTSHSSGGRWWAWGRRFWPMLPARIDYRIAVSEEARSAAEPNIGGPFEIVPNGVPIPDEAELDDRPAHVAFVGRHEQRKGLPVLLQAWPEVHRRTGARLRLMGADPLAVRYLLRRLGVSEAGIDILGIVTAETRTAEVLQSRVLAAPAIGAETFGMVLAEAFGCGTPVVASDIPGYREVASAETGILTPPGDVEAVTAGLVELLEDEGRRRTLATRAREIAHERYAWEGITERLVEIYAALTGRSADTRLVSA